jgi:flagellar hook-length control protein FliK
MSAAAQPVPLVRTSNAGPGPAPAAARRSAGFADLLDEAPAKTTPSATPSSTLQPPTKPATPRKAATADDKAPVGTGNVPPPVTAAALPFSPVPGSAPVASEGAKPAAATAAPASAQAAAAAEAAQAAAPQADPAVLVPAQPAPVLSAAKASPGAATGQAPPMPSQDAEATQDAAPDAPAPSDSTADGEAEPAPALATLSASSAGKPATDPSAGLAPSAGPAAASGPSGTVPVLAPGLAPTAADPSADASDRATGDAPQGAAAPPPAPAIQVAVALRNAASLDSGQSFTLRLQPERLGTVEVKLEIDAKGRATASFVADRPEALQLLQRDSHQLVAALKQAGVEADPGALSFGLRDGNAGGEASGRQAAGGRTAMPPGMSSRADAAEDLPPTPRRALDRLYDIHA